jgi:hypothetical protein
MAHKEEERRRELRHKKERERERRGQTREEKERQLGVFSYLDVYVTGTF